MTINEFKSQLGIETLPLKDAGEDDKGNAWLRAFLNEQRISILIPSDSVEGIKSGKSIISLDKGNRTSKSGKSYKLYIVFVDSEVLDEV